MKNWLISIFIALMLIYHVSCLADGYSQKIPVYTGDINDPGISVVDYEDEYIVIEFDGEIFIYPIE